MFYMTLEMASRQKWYRHLNWWRLLGYLMMFASAVVSFYAITYLIFTLKGG